MEKNIDNLGENNPQIIQENADVIINTGNKNQQQIAGAIILAGIIIAGAILLNGKTAPSPNTANPALAVTIAKVGKDDRTLGNPNAKVTLIMYEDFQCPFCGKFDKETEQTIRGTYVKDGRVQLVYRDFAFLGPESTKAAEAARCAGDQGKFWDYHDYLFSHQNGENKGGFSDENLKSFAIALNFDTAVFNQCLDSGKYTQAVTDSTTEGGVAGVRGTPKGFVLKNGKTVSTIDGAEPSATAITKIEAALK